MPELLSIAALGALTLHIGQQPVAGLNSRKAGALLVYLASSTRRFSRDTLAALLWGEQSTRRAQGNLRMTLALLRGCAAPYLDLDRSAVGMQPGTYTLDCQQLMQAVESTRRYGLVRGGLPASAASRLAETLALYRGELLEGFSGGSAAFEQWLHHSRERLRACYTEGILRLSDYYFKNNAFGAGLALLGTALRRNPQHAADYTSARLLGDRLEAQYPPDNA